MDRNIVSYELRNKVLQVCLVLLAMLRATHGGRYLRSKSTLKKILRLPELKPSITVLTKDSLRMLFLYVSLICDDEKHS